MKLVSSPARTLLFLVLWLLMLSALAIAVEHFGALRSAPSQISSLPGFTSTGLPIRLHILSDRKFSRGDEESVLGWSRRISSMVHLTTSHCAPEPTNLSWVEKYLHERWPDSASLFSEGVLVRSRFYCGYCHQRAYFVHEALVDEGISSEVFSLEGHVVVRFWVAGEIFVLDPDYGIGPFRWSDDEQELLTRVRREYAYSGFENVERVAALYASMNNNHAYSNGYLDRARDEQKRFYSEADRYARYLTMFAALSAVFLAPWTWAIFRKRAKSHKSDLVTESLNLR